MITLLVVGVPLACLILLAILGVRRWFAVEELQAQLDHQILLAIDRGDHAEVAQLRERKIEVMLYGE